MIVKNEEEFLAGCLESIHEFVDEIVIVDTGSEDNTVEIAKRFTHKIYHHPWENSFSKARNQALQYASCDWVFQIDADEELAPGSGQELQKAVREAGDTDIIFVAILSSYANGSKSASHNFERLFRNHQGIHYEGDVHNRIVGGSKATFSSIRLIHHGYDVNEQKSQAKFTRTTDLLKNEISRDPHNPLYHHYLGVSYLSRNMNKESAEESELAIKLADRQNNENPIYLWTHFNASMAHYRLGNLEKTKFYAQKAHRNSPGHLDSLYMLAVVAAEQREWDRVLLYAEKYTNLLHLYEADPGKAGLLINNTMKESSIVFTLVGHAYAMYDRVKMRQWYEKALEYSDGDGKIPCKIGAFHLDRTSDLGLAEFYLKLALEQAPSDPEIRYVLAKFYKASGSPEKEKECLEWLYQNGNTEPVIFNRLIKLYTDHGDLALALEVAIKAGELYPGSDSRLARLLPHVRKEWGPEKTIEYCLTALERHPHVFEIWNEVGELCIEIGRIDDAKVFFERAISLSPERTTPLLRLCEISIRRHAPDELIHFFNILLGDLNIHVPGTIGDMADLLRVLLEVSSALSFDPESTALAQRIAKMFQIEFSSFLSDHASGSSSVDSFPLSEQRHSKIVSSEKLFPAGGTG